MVLKINKEKDCYLISVILKAIYVRQNKESIILWFGKNRKNKQKELDLNNGR
jgi:hypothetical protein